jgi:hypothetical protein
VGGSVTNQQEPTDMHSLNSALARKLADERVRAAQSRAIPRHRSDRPPKLPVRGRAAYAAGRFARRLDREMARRAVI